MATNIKQYASILSLKGVIDREKNIYFVPKFPDFTSEYYDAYPSNIKVCSYYASMLLANSFGLFYDNQEISRWSPEDRTLSVLGDVMSFREGNKYDYVLIKRRIETNSPYAGVSLAIRDDFKKSSSFIPTINNIKLNNFFNLVKNEMDPNPVEERTLIAEAWGGTTITYKIFDRLGNQTFSQENITEIYLHRFYDSDEERFIYKLDFNLTSGTDDLYLDEYYEGIDGKTTVKVSSDDVDDFEIHFIDFMYVEGWYDIFFGFFIDNVTQTGTSTVRLNLSPDYFTNAFYLSQSVGISQYYDPFNASMKECYVERQHYDRVDKDLKLVNMNMFTNLEETYKYRYQYRDKRNILPFNNQPVSSVGSEVSFGEVELNAIKSATNMQELVQVFDNLGLSTLNKFRNACVAYYHIIFKENKTLPLIVHTGEEADGGILYQVYRNSWHSMSYLDDDKNISSAYSHIIIPFVNIPKEFSNLKSFLNINIRIKMKDYHDEIQTLDTYDSIANIIKAINDRGFGPYIISHYITKTSSLSALMQTVEEYNNSTLYVSYLGKTPSGKKVRYNVPWNPTGDASLGPGYYDVSVADSGTIAFLPLDLRRTFVEANNEGNIDDGTFSVKTGICVENTDERWLELSELESNKLCVCFIQGNDSMDERNITLEYLKPSINLKSEYYDTVLESEPYSFYSVSLYTNEVPFYRNRFYQMSNSALTSLAYSIPVKYLASFNEALKIGLIPSYTLDNISNRYYTEGLVVTLASTLPVRNDSFYSFYYQNMAQMKNQYAVNNFNRGVNLGQRFFNTGPARVASGFVSGGKAKGFATLIDEVSGMIDDSIDWAQSNHEIEMNQKAKMADAGAKPDVYKQAGSDIIYDINSQELGFYLNHYTIDSVSYTSIAKMLERYGYQVKMYDTMNIYNRKGWNFVKLFSFDYNKYVEGYNIKLNDEEREAISDIFKNGVTLLHSPRMLATEAHNYEIVLD